jgi:hypothetical protein
MSVSVSALPNVTEDGLATVASEGVGSLPPPPPPPPPHPPLQGGTSAAAGLACATRSTVAESVATTTVAATNRIRRPTWDRPIFEERVPTVQSNRRGCVVVHHESSEPTADCVASLTRPPVHVARRSRSSTAPRRRAASRYQCGERPLETLHRPALQRVTLMRDCNQRIRPESRHADSGIVARTAIGSCSGRGQPKSPNHEDLEAERASTPRRPCLSFRDVLTRDGTNCDALLRRLPQRTCHS